MPRGDEVTRKVRVSMCEEEVLADSTKKKAKKKKLKPKKKSLFPFSAKKKKA